jgi:polar amino acid transport system permease protein
VLHYDWNWDVIWLYRYALLQGLAVTALLCSVSILSGTVTGLILGVGLSERASAPSLIRRALLFFVDVVKALPQLILLLLLYYWLPYAIGIRSSFWIAVIALALGLSVFIADVFRHAINGIPRPFVDACYALGMTRRDILHRFIIPEALRAVIPTLGLLYIDVFKLSSLASIIAVPELVHRASQISAYSYRFLEVYAALALIYLLILLPFSYGIRRLETSAWFLRRS